MKARFVARFSDPEDLARARKERKAVTDHLRYIRLRDEIRARAKAWREGNLERARENKRNWLQKNKEKRNAYYRRYYELHPERQEYLRMKAREYRERDRG